MSLIPPHQIAQERTVDADAVLGGQVDLRAYPHRHLMIVTRHRWGRSGLPLLLAAVEHLSNYGWDLVNVLALSEGPAVYAVMRRTA
ncbi:hypothetical protein [Micromonospora sp. NPDC048169]|uniref:hypothetical protein n=1 Tax=unclassified Micromonospora TaxID=2617518 RepID=UPI0034090858